VAFIRNDINFLNNFAKAGNCQARRLLIEAGHSLYRGRAGYKAKVLKNAKKSCSAAVTAYADRTDARLRRKGYRVKKEINNKILWLQHQLGSRH
jgi:hypothetical protein